MGVLRAVRMIDFELGTTHLLLLHCLDMGYWFHAGRVPSTDSWERFAPDVAGEIDPRAWRALVAAQAEVVRFRGLYQALAEDNPARDMSEERLYPGVIEEMNKVLDAIAEARILIRPINLGGSTFPTQPGFWFPETPELLPESLSQKVRRSGRFYMRRRLRGSSEPAADPDGAYAPMPYGIVFIPRSELEAERETMRPT